MLPKSRLHSVAPPQVTVPTLLHATPWHGPRCSSPPVQAEVVEGADNQRAGGQGSAVRQNVYQGYRPDSAGVFPPKDGLERTAMKSTRKIKERDRWSAATYCW